MTSRRSATDSGDAASQRHVPGTAKPAAPPPAHLTKGVAGEALAATHLSGHGLVVLERNFRVRGGEIDLICRDRDSIVFVEVRLRSRTDFGGAGASIGPRKQARLVLAARHWLARHGERPCRFDCVLIDAGQLTWIRDAFRPE